MNELQSFISNRQHPQTESRRQLADQLRFPATSVKLEHQDGRMPSTKTNYTNASGQPSVNQNAAKLLIKASQSPSTFRDGFDTDAEGFDDTTITSDPGSMVDKQVSAPFRYGSTVSNPVLRTNDNQHQFHGKFGATHDHIRGESIERAGITVMEDDDEMYEESGDESDSEDGNGPGQEGHSINVNILAQLNSPGFSRYQQELQSLSHQGVHQQPKDSNSDRKMAMRNAPDPNGLQFEPNVSQKHFPGVNTAGLKTELIQDNKVRAPSSLTQGKLVEAPVPDIRTLNKSISPNLPRALQRTLQNVGHEADRLPTLTRTPRKTSHHFQNPEIVESHVGNSHADPQNIMPPASSRKHMRQVESSQDLPTHSDGGRPVSMSYTGLDDEDLSFDAKKAEDEDRITDPAASEADLKTRKRGRDLDYSLDQLSGMTYDQLRNEPFHVVPQATDPILPTAIENGTLSEKLDYLAHLDDTDTRNTQGKGFLASLPIEDYEKCGEIMVQRFSQIVLMFTNSRQQRRKVIEEFEDEVAKREERVRGKVEAFEKHFSKLKQGGEDVVRQRLDM